MKKDFAIIIGRFQPLHLGHQRLVEHALTQARQVIICLGSAYGPRTIKNPWTYAERAEMFKAVFPNKLLVFVPIRDYHYNDTRWIREVRNQVFYITGFPDERLPTCVLVGHKKDVTSYYLDLFPEFEFSSPPHPGKFAPTGEELENFQNSFINATDVRNAMFEGEDFHHLVPAEVFNNQQLYYKVDFLQSEYNHIKSYKALWKDIPYKPTFLTVDSVVNDDGHILLVERASEPGKGLWALPGGFVNESEYLIDAAIRETKEETSVDLDKKNMVEYDVFDYPTRSLRGRTITTAYYFKTTGNIKAKASDDAKRAFWVSVPEAMSNESKFFEDHYAIICKFLLNDE